MRKPRRRRRRVGDGVVQNGRAGGTKQNGQQTRGKRGAGTDKTDPLENDSLLQNEGIPFMDSVM